MILILSVLIAVPIAVLLHRKIHGQRVGMTPLAGYIGAWMVMVGLYIVDPLQLYKATSFAWVLIAISFITFIVGYGAATYRADPRSDKTPTLVRTPIDTAATKPLSRLWLILIGFGAVVFAVYAFEVARTYGASPGTLAALRIAQARGHALPGIYFFIFVEPIAAISVILAMIDRPRRVLYLAGAGLSIALLLTTSGRSNAIFAILWALCAFAIYQGPNLIRPRPILVAFAALVVGFGIFWAIGDTVGKSYHNSYVYARFGDHPPIPAPFVNAYLYLEGPVPTLSAVVQHTHSFGLGRYTLRPVFEALALVDHHVAVPPHIQPFESIPYPFNVATYLALLFRDFGVPGIVVGPALLGFLLGSIYALWRRRPSPAVLALAAFACVVSIYSIFDWLLSDLSRVLEIGALAAVAVLEGRGDLLDGTWRRKAGQAIEALVRHQSVGDQ